MSDTNKIWVAVPAPIDVSLAGKGMVRIPDMAGLRRFFHEGDRYYVDRTSSIERMIINGDLVITSAPEEDK
jgi:hypothetical protein